MPPILGIDYGAKKIGLAKSDENESMALPFDIIPNKSKQEVKQKLLEVCEQNDISKIVVGVPVSFSKGKSQELIRDVDLENEQMKEVLSFIDWLKGVVELPIEMEDERLTTKMANNMNKGMIKNGSDDDVAAMLILQNYLDRQKL